MALLLRNISYLVRDADRVEQDCDVLVEGNRIVHIGHKLAAEAGTDVIDARGCAVIPGLINAHTHLYQNLLKGVSGGLTLVPWCNQVLFPTVAAIQERFRRGDHRAAFLWSALGVIEMIRAGVTCCQNMDLMAQEILRAWREIGFRGVAAYTLANAWLPEHLQGNEDRIRDDVLNWIDTWHEPDGLIQIAIGPSAPFLCDDGLLIWARDQAEAFNLGIHIHLAETAVEVAEGIRDWGVHPVERLNRLGFLSQRVSAVHCVYMDEQEIQTFLDQAVQVVHCPKSNMKLADGIAPVTDYIRSGLSVSLGTDGCGSNDLLDMWEEMRAAIFLARVSTGDAAALSAADVFRMATVEAAKACRIDAGLIDPGRLADLAIIDLGAVHLRPLHDVLNTLVFCGRASDVRDTIINGQVVMQDRRLIGINEQAIIEEADQLESDLFAHRKEYRTE